MLQYKRQLKWKTVGNLYDSECYSSTNIILDGVADMKS